MGLGATPFLAKSVSDCSAEGVLTDGLEADHSGGTAADSHGLPRFTRLLIVDSQSSAPRNWCQLGVNERSAAPFGCG